MSQTALFKGVCYKTQVAAKKAVCSDFHQVWGSGQSVVSAQCVTSNYSDSVMNICRQIDGGTCRYFTQQWPQFPECEYSGGIQMAGEWFYLALPIMVAVFFYRRLIALFNASDER